MKDDIILSRTSCRDFLPTPVEDEKITAILRAAMQAPSALNQQPWEFFVVKDSFVKGEIAAITPYWGPAKECNVLIVVCKDIKNLKSNSFSDIDCAMASENALLEAHAQGLGAVYLGAAPKEERVRDLALALDIKSGLAPFGLICLGYPAKKKEPVIRYLANKVHVIG